MKRNLIVWASEGEPKVFHNVLHSYIVGNHLMFNTEASGINQCGVNMHEVICWEFVLIPAASDTGD